MIRAAVPLRTNRARPLERVAITGGAGFIGTNLADRFATDGHRVLVYDDLSRPGVEKNLHWLTRKHGDRVQVHVGCVTDPWRVRTLVRDTGAVFHLAAQVAVTTSVHDPQSDFAVNLRGTVNLLEAVRELDEPPHLIFTSTNKVYGRLPDVRLEEGPRAYRPVSKERRAGVTEEQPLDFHSPYGCSKGGADQYILDYSRTFGLPTTVFRMSCVYGPHQHGTEDQGWVAHFLIRALEGRPLTIFGDGKQVRDILYVSDLVDACMAAVSKPEHVVGRAFNIGGGPDNAVSLLEVLDELEALHGASVPVELEEWRPGDQRWYVSDTRSFHAATGWAPSVAKKIGLRRLYAWLQEHRGAGGTGRTAEAPAVTMAG